MCDECAGHHITANKQQNIIERFVAPPRRRWLHTFTRYETLITGALESVLLIIWRL